MRAEPAHVPRPPSAVCAHVPRPPSALYDATTRIWDAVVIGAGPAGAVAARQLVRGGAAVLLVERAVFPRDKVCGCCLNRRSLAALAAIGLGDLPDRCGAVPLNSFHWSAGRSHVTLPLPGGAALSRRTLDAALAREAAACGAALFFGTSAVVGDVDGDARCVRLAAAGGEGIIRARVVLAACGLTSRHVYGAAPIRLVERRSSRIGAAVRLERAPADYRAGTTYMACGPAGYAGLVRLEDGRLDVAAALDPAAVRSQGGLGAAVEAIVHSAGFPRIEGLATAAWRGTPPLTRRAIPIAAERLLLIGDAAGYVEPFTGEGIAWALEGGIAAAGIAQRAIGQWAPECARSWTRAHRRIVTGRQRICRAMSLMLRSPRATRAVIQALRFMPAAASPVLHRLNRGQKKAGARVVGRPLQSLS